MNALSKTAALREASTAVSIHGRGTSWTIICPHDKIDGPSTELRADSYALARAKAARAKASIALTLMGQWSDRADEAMYNADDVRDTRALVEIGLKATARG